MVPDESRGELHSTKLAYIQLGLWTAMGVTAVLGYLFGYGTGNKLLEQPLPHKIVIVICMLMFLYNIGMTIKKAGRFTATEGVLLFGAGQCRRALSVRRCCTMKTTWYRSTTAGGRFTCGSKVSGK